jgi:diguanylate cyclase (GGDEF)-like protein
MSTRTWRIDIKQDGPPADGDMSRGSYDRPSKEVENGRADPGVEAVVARADAGRLRSCREGIVRIGRAACARSFGVSRGHFEEALHRIAGDLEEARSPDAVEAALIRFAREIAPTSRFALIRTRAEAADSMNLGPGGVVSGDEVERPVPEKAPRPGEVVAEVPLIYGFAIHGRLLVFKRRGPRSAPRPITLQRMVTACTMAACVLENLRQNSEWSWHGQDEADEDDRVRQSQVHSPDVTRDATFLNAVLPFALSQAMRHREPASLLCLAIDRLAAIQDLLGHQVADRLVQDVARTVGSLVRSSDIVARLDDNRIVVLLMRARGQSALTLARMIGRTMSETSRNVTEFPPTTVSIGVAEFPGDARNAFALLEASDDALARAQSQGQGQAVRAKVQSITAPASGSSTAARPASCPC